jgi:hypothetical protein
MPSRRITLPTIWRHSHASSARESTPLAARTRRVASSAPPHGRRTSCRTAAAHPSAQPPPPPTRACHRRRYYGGGMASNQLLSPNGTISDPAASAVGLVVWCLDPADLAFAWEYTTSACGMSIYGCLNHHVHGCCGAIQTAVQYWWRIAGVCELAASVLLLVGAIGAHVIMHKILLSPVPSREPNPNVHEALIRRTRHPCCRVYSVRLLLLGLSPPYRHSRPDVMRRCSRRCSRSSRSST